MKLYRVILPVTNITEAARFYAAIFSDTGIRVSPGRHYFNLGTIILACYDPVTDGDGTTSHWVFHENQYLYFSTPDLEKVHQQCCELGCKQVDKKIELMPWGERLFYALDPFGNPICFVDEKTVFTGD